MLPRAHVVVLLVVATTGPIGTWQLALARQGDPREAAQSRVVLSQRLPALDGRHLDIQVVDVMYGPGGSSTPHRHPCPVVGYVIKGELRMQIQGGRERLYKAGDSFYEGPGDIHIVSANASAQAPARFLAYFVCDHETALSVAVPERKGR